MNRRVFTLFALLVAFLPLQGCSTSDLLNALAPRAGITVKEDIAYGDGPRRVLDIYAPTEAHNAPGVVFFYGGGWISGSRTIYRFLGAALASRGVVVVVPDYRLHPETEFPGFVEDAASAVAWTVAHIGDYGGDAKKLFLMGHSAGGEIAALLALDPEYLKAVNLSPANLAGFIGLAGPYDFLPLTNPVYKIIFGPEDQLWRSQPINFVTKDAPPMFLAMAKLDDTVGPRNAYNLTDRMKAVGRPVDLRVYPSVGHITLIGAFAAQLAFLAPVRDDVLAFIARQVAPPA